MRILIAAIAFNQSDSLDDAEPMCIALKTVPAHVWKSCERLGCAVAKSDCSDAASCVEHTRSFSATAACKKAIGRPSEYTLVEHTSDAVRVSPARLDSPGLHWCFLTDASARLIFNYACACACSGLGRCDALFGPPWLNPRSASLGLAHPAKSQRGCAPARSLS